jgi:hypothetical protein
MPDVKGVKVLGEQDQPDWHPTLRSLLASHRGQKLISIAIGGSRGQQEEDNTMMQGSA